MSDYGEKTCPLCAEEMDLTDQQLNPCKCGYQICVWCWHHIMDMAEKDQTEGRCPACRTPYDKEKIVGMTVDRERLNSEGNIERKKTQKSKLKPSEGRKQLANVRVVQRNLVYIVGLPFDLADEDILQRKEYFGQYGKVLKVSMSRTATGLIQQFPNNTCCVYITYAKEEEAVRCIQSVHGFILDGKVLKACFGTTKYCHAWLRNAACNNPDCLYLHEVGSQEDSFTKDEIIPAHTRVQQITGATNTLQYRSGSVLPPPMDAYCSDSSNAKPIAKVPSTTAAASSPKSSPPSGSSVRSTALPAAASWGTRITNQQSLATSTASNGSLDNHRSMPENGTLAMPTENAAHSHVSTINTLQKPPHKEESQTLAQKSKPSMSKRSQNNVVVDPGSKRTVSPSRDPSSNQVSCVVESSYDSRVIEEPSAVENSFDSTNEIAEDVPNVSNLAAEVVACIGINTNAKDENPGVPVAIGAYCDQGSIRQPGNNAPNLEQCGNYPPTNTAAEADVSQNGIPCSRVEWDWRSGLQSHVQVNSALEVDGLSSVNSCRRDVSDSTYRCSPSSSVLDSVHTASRPFQTRENSGGFDSHTGSSFEIGNDRVHLPNGFSETSRSGSNMQHSLFANTEGRNNIQSIENDIISNILDFDPWDESLTMPPNIAKLLGQNDHWDSSLEQSSLLKQRNDQSRFSFARHEESNNQAYVNNNTYNIYGQLSRGQPIQEFGVNREIYQDKFGSRNGFASNYSGAHEQFAASPGVSSYRSPAVRSQVSAPPGFSAPSKLPPPGFSSHERVNMSSDFVSGTRLFDLSSVLRNGYHVPPPSSNLNTAGDVEFIDPAILAVGRGRIQNGMENGADFDMRSGFYSQLSSFEKDARLHQLLGQQRSQAAQQQESRLNNFVPSVSDHYFLLNKQWP